MTRSRLNAISHAGLWLPGVLWLVLAGRAGAADGLDWIGISDDHRGFVRQGSGRAFLPWGFNYDHDETGRLLEDYWVAEWPKVEQDFQEMRALGANVVRIHLQLGRFMKRADEADDDALRQLSRLLALAEKLRLYLDLTGLGCYHKPDVPAWYDALGEAERWAVQARFWEAVATCCASSPAVFCYDLMNEPVVPGGQGKDWLGPAFGGKYFVQFITRDQRERPRPEIAVAWIRQLKTAIRKHDARHLTTVGLVPWSLDVPGLSSGFVPEKIAPDLDFICVHIYPTSGKLAADIATLRGFAVGKPVLVEETFPLSCTAAELEQFMDDRSNPAAGWVGFYWGKTVDDYRDSKELADALVLSWLELFKKKAPRQPAN